VVVVVVVVVVVDLNWVMPLTACPLPLHRQHRATPPQSHQRSHHLSAASPTRSKGALRWQSSGAYPSPGGAILR